MEKTLAISGVAVNGKKFNLFIIVFVGGGAVLFVFLGVVTHMYFFFIMTALFVSIIPSIFSKKIKRRFSKKVRVVFSPENFTVSLFNIDNEYLEREDINKFSEISMFNLVTSMNDNSVYIKMSFKDGYNLKYTFLNQKAKSEGNIIEPLVRYIKDYPCYPWRWP